MSKIPTYPFLSLKLCPPTTEDDCALTQHELVTSRVQEAEGSQATGCTSSAICSPERGTRAQGTNQ